VWKNKAKRISGKLNTLISQPCSLETLCFTNFQYEETQMNTVAEAWIQEILRKKKKLVEKFELSLSLYGTATW